jgi:DNA-binding transcriptional LysR family regulator
MEIQQLKFFIEVAKEKNLTRASSKLGTVQSNVTAKLKQLEFEVGHELFIRSKKGMDLTEKGITLLPLAEKLIAYEREIQNTMEAETFASGKLSLALLDSFIRIFMNKIIPTYVKTYPEVELQLQTGINKSLFQLLDSGEADIIGVVGKKYFAGYEVVFSQKAELVLVSKGKVTEHLPLLILGLDCFFGQTTNEYFKFRNKVLKIGSIESILTSVMAGIGVTILPRALVQDKKYKNLHFKTIKTNCYYSLVRKKGKPANKAQVGFIELFR